MKAVFAVLLIFLQLSDYAQGQVLSGQANRDPIVMQGLLYIIAAKPDIRTAAAGNKLDFGPTATRGGNGSPFHPKLGCYVGGDDDNVEFSSGYEYVDALTMAAWAYDLHEYVISLGGGWENYSRFGGTRLGGALDRAMIPYSDLYGWAESYWDQNRFRPKPSVSSPFPDPWMGDAILDGLNIYLLYQQRMLFSDTNTYYPAATGFLSYKDITLLRLIRQIRTAQTRPKI